MKAYQQRVVDEKTELDIKIKALKSFFDAKYSPRLSSDAGDILSDQYETMERYSNILRQRIEAFAMSE